MEKQFGNFFIAIWQSQLVKIIRMIAFAFDRKIAVIFGRHFLAWIPYQQKLTNT